MIGNVNEVHENLTEIERTFFDLSYLVPEQKEIQIASNAINLVENDHI